MARRPPEAFRYLAAPPISLDDLKTLAEAPSLAKGPDFTLNLKAAKQIGLTIPLTYWLERIK
jgi:hypothetical protein